MGFFDELPDIDFSQLPPGTDLTPIAAQYGLTRDQLAQMRDDWLQSNLGAFRAQYGDSAAEDDLTALRQMNGGAPLAPPAPLPQAPAAPSLSGALSSSYAPQGSPIQPVGLSALVEQPATITPQQFSFDASNLGNTDGFKFDLEQGIKAIDRAAAAKGKSFTNDTREELMRFGQGLASGELNNEYNRQLSTFNTNAGRSDAAFDQNQQNLLNTFNINRTNQNDAWSRGTDVWNANRADTNDAWGRGLDVYGLNRQDQNDQFNQAYSLSNLILSNRPRPS